MGQRPCTARSRRHDDRQSCEGYDLPVRQKYALENRQARQEALGDHAPALTVIIAGIFDEAWLLEIKAIAEA